MKQAFLTLSLDERREIFNQTAIAMGIPAQAVEKDWWVCLTLKAIFNSEHATYLSFKGGTSLSKGWRLIQRFSEDIDLAIDKTKWGYDETISNTQIGKLREKSRVFVRTELKDTIEKQFTELGITIEELDIKVTEKVNNDGKIIQDHDPTELIIAFQSLFDAHEYLQAQVKIEVSARSMKDPVEVCLIRSFVDENYTDQDFAMPAFKVTCVLPIRTFLEKAILLHEGFEMGIEGDRAEKKSRHFYDLVQLMDTEQCKNAATDEELFKKIIVHREKYTKEKGVDYTKLSRATLSILPPKDKREFWRQDYVNMIGSMIQGETLSFEELLKQLEILEHRFHTEPKEEKL